jgi:hypothetical protein
VTGQLLSSMQSLLEDLNGGGANGRTYTLSSINAQRAFVDTHHCRWAFLTYGRLTRRVGCDRCSTYAKLSVPQRESSLLRLHNTRC